MITTKDFCKKEYGTSLYKISFDAGFTCPNRDGTLATGGCIFCSAKGSGDFAVTIPHSSNICNLNSCPASLSDDSLSTKSGIISSDTAASIEEQIQLAKDKIKSKYRGDKYIAYFQSFTNTYADVDTLRNIYYPIITRDDIAVLSIATRPDCLSDEIYSLLQELNGIKPVWVELGLQTTNKKTIKYIRRGYNTSVYDKAVKRLKAIGVHVITHMILYLPGENEEDMLNTLSHILKVGSDGVKFQLLHVLKDTDLANDFLNNPFPIPTLSMYAETIKKCVDMCGDDIVIHRITGDPPKRLLIEPKWAADKKNVLNTINDIINPPAPYYVYILECEDGTYYTGSTDDVIKRFDKHKLGNGAKYTKAHHPVKILYVEKCHGKRAALRREYEIKQLKKREKVQLISSSHNISYIFNND